MFGPSVSFAPDGVDIAGKPNQLTQTLDAAFPGQDWRETILSGFQRWSAQANMNVRIVNERGVLPFGVEGHQFFDSRFGEIRIGARPLSSSIKAITIPNDSALSGTWAGDVVFNSSATFDSLDELLTVALHEAGHALGLTNSDEPNSAMNSIAAEIVTEPSDRDIAAIRTLFGAPQPDEFESPARNDFIDQATIAQFHTSENYAGWSAFAEIEQDDIDFYSVTIPNCCSENWSVTVGSRTSLLVPEVTIFDGQRNVLAHSEGTHDDDLIESVLSTEDVGNQIYVRVASPRRDEFSTGSYVVSAVPQLPEGNTFTVHRDSEPYVPPPEPEIRELTEKHFFNNFTQFPRILRTDDPDSQDLFSFPIDFTDETTVEVQVVPLFRGGGVVPDIKFIESTGEAIASTVLVNDLTGKLIQVPMSDLPPDFLLSVTPAEGDRLTNYDLRIRFHTNPLTLDPFAQGQLTSSRPLNAHPFHVPVSQLTHFSLGLNGDAGQALALIQKADGEFIQFVDAAVGETKTLSGVLLPPGDYQVSLYAIPHASVRMSYSLTRTVVSDPFGVALVEPNDLDFSCPGVADAFCYPGEVESEQPNLWEDFLEDQPGLPAVPPADQPEVFLGPWWNWFWNTTQPDSNSPPLAISDQYESHASHMLSIGSALGVLANDVDPNRNDVQVSIQREPLSGQLDLYSDGSFVYRPFPGFFGKDSFDYRISDGEHQSRIATVTLIVTAPVMAGDFDADGGIGVNDIDVVAAAVNAASDMRFDLDESGTVDESDLAYMVHTIVNTKLGDINLDGKVDGIDLNVVGKHWQQSVSSWSQGDFNGDGIVDAWDLNKIGQSWPRQDANGSRMPRAAFAVRLPAYPGMPPRWVISKDGIPIAGAINVVLDPATNPTELPTWTTVDPCRNITPERMPRRTTHIRSRRVGACPVSGPMERGIQAESGSPAIVDAVLRFW